MTELSAQSNRSPVPALSVISAVIHVAAFLAVRYAVFSIGVLSEADYEEQILVLRVVKRCFRSIIFWPLVTSVLVFRKRLLLSWSQLSPLPEFRWFAAGMALALTATFGAQEFNLYFGHAYLIDRLVLLGLALLIALRPVFIVPFAIQVVAVGGQFSYPMSAHGWDEHMLGIYRLPIHLLLVIFTALLLRSDDDDRQAARSTVLVSLVVIAAGYWVPGITKLRMDWMTVPNVQYSFFGAWCHGWLCGVSPDRVVEVTNSLRRVAVPLQWATVLFECGAIFVLWRRMSLILLSVWIIFHFGALVLYGYAFWLWILIDASALVFVFFRREVVCELKWQHAVLAALLIATSSRWLNPNRLAWFNAPLANSYQFVAVTDKQKRYELPPEFFAPYDYIFTMKWFEYASEQRQVTGPYATTMDRRYALMTGDALRRTQEQRGQKQRDEIRVEELSRFLKRYMKNWNTKRNNSSALQYLKPPTLLNSTCKTANIPVDETVLAIEIQRIRTVFNQGSIERKNMNMCLRVDVR